MTDFTRRNAVALLAAAPMTLATPAQAATHKVRIRQMKFTPSSITIKAGDSVVWSNDDGLEHTATGINKDWGTKSLRRGRTGTIAFPHPGEYKYFCKWHPDMRGTVIVT